MAFGRQEASITRHSRLRGLLKLLLLAAGCTSPHAAQQPRPLAVADAPTCSSVARSETPFARPGVAVTAAKPAPASVAPRPAIQQAQHTERKAAPEKAATTESPPGDRYPVDLATALRLAGANNLQVALAAERVRQA